jgi:hypothetical protein
MKKPRKTETAGKPGPKAEALQIEGDWKDAVASALQRGKPVGQKAQPQRKPKKK